MELGERGETNGRSLPHWTVMVLLVTLVVGLRSVALGSDAYLRLDWSAGLLTDEGFYIHNSRNVALFGRAQTDEFNNMLLSPLLHYAQVAVFTLFGAGAVQARLISVVCSLITIGLLYSALQRAFDNRIAITAAAFLGLDHVVLLYNRMALMDTPATMVAVAALYAFIRARDHEAARARSGWSALSGALLGVTVANRMLCVYLLPIPFLALLPEKRRGRVTAVYLAAGLGVVAALYSVLWYLPNRAEIAPMNAYYRTHQVQPRSVNHLIENVRHALVGDFRGVSPYLFRHTPVLFALALLGLLGGVARREESPDENGAGAAAARYLAWWLLLGWAALAVISYSPSRYYVSFYPALSALAAITVWNLDRVWASLSGPCMAARLARGSLAAFAAFHAALALVHYGGVLPAAQTAAVLYGVPIAAGIGAAWMGTANRAVAWCRVAPALLGIWGIVNGAWLVDWARHIDYTQRDTSRWLAANLPSNSVLMGDVAPGLSLDNSFRAVHVQPGLVNDENPVERFAGSPRYIVILDGRWKERYWLDRYPELVAPERRVKQARVLRWDVGIYSADGRQNTGSP